MNKILQLALALACLNGVFGAPSLVEVSPGVTSALKTEGRVDIILRMRQSTVSVLENIKSQSFINRAARINAVASSLQAVASTSQKSVLEFLKSQNYKFKSFWINNKIWIEGADASLIHTLSGFPEIESIQEDKVEFEPLPHGTPVESNFANVQWGIDKIGAPAAWAQGYTGRGVVVGSLDTGVRYTHKSLYQNFRRERGWLDTTGSNSELPYDDDGHGTHVMGTIVGSYGLGVAPEATWMACRAPLSGYSTYIQCAEFFLCPTHPDGTEPDCSAAPHLISHSWGKPHDREEDFLDEFILAWSAAGIHLTWSNGNNGPACSTTKYPSNTAFDIISVGATDSSDRLASFSSRGPGRFSGALKPNIAAPGVRIISASADDDESLASYSGTSMASPHAAGVVALLLTNGTELTFGEITDFMYKGAAHTVPSTGGNCGGISETSYPNNAVGYGRLSAAGAIAALRASRNK